jgi:hypothetical protein
LAAAAIADRGLADTVAGHKSIFFAEKDAGRLDYHAAVSGGLTLVPEGAARDALAEDYARMVEDGLLLDEAEIFDVLMTDAPTSQSEQMPRRSDDQSARTPN